MSSLDAKALQDDRAGMAFLHAVIAPSVGDAGLRPKGFGIPTQMRKPGPSRAVKLRVREIVASV